MKLKHLLMKTLFVAVGLCVGQSVWGDEVTVYDLTGQADDTMPTLNTITNHKAGGSSGQNVYTAIDEVFRGGFAFQSVGASNFFYKGGNLRNQGGTRYLSLLNLKAGDKIVFTFTTANNSSQTDKHFTVEECGTSGTTNLSLSAGGSAIAINTDMESGTAYFVLADGYVDFATRKNCYITRVEITHPNTNLPDMTRVWGQSFLNLVPSDFQMEITTNGGSISKGISASESNYYIPSTDGTNALTHTNIGFYVSYSGNGNHRHWKIYSNTSGAIYGMVNANMEVHLYNLVRGQIVKVVGGGLYAGSGTLTALTAYDIDATYDTRYYQVNANGTGVITVSGNGRILSVDVYNTNNEIVGAMDKSSGFASWVGSGIDVPKDGAVLLKFKNHGTNTQNYYNWCLGINDNSDAFKANIRADWAALDEGGVFTYQYASSSNAGTTAGSVNWTDFKNDLQDADVELNLTYKDGKLFITGTTFKDDNIYYFNYTYGDGTYDKAKWIVHPFVEKAWLEIISKTSTSVRTAPVHATSISAGNVGTTGYSTFASTLYPLDLSVISGAEVYYAEAVNGSTVKFKSTDASVPAGEGLLLKGTAGTAVTINIADAGTAISGNLLKGCTTETAGVSGADKYVLVNNGGTAEFQNLSAHDATIPAGKAYLDATGAGARSLTIVFDDEDVTGVNEVRSQKEDVRSEWFDLQGRKVAQPAKGLYIVNGKKVVIK